MAPGLRWIFAAMALVVVWFVVLNVPVRATFTQPDGALIRRNFRSYGEVAAWGVPADRWVHERFSDRRNTWIPEDARVIAYRSWGDGVGLAALWWMIACGLLWPFFRLLRSRAGWSPTAPFSLVCLVLGLVGFSLVATSEGGSGVAEISLPLLGLALVTGRAAGATEEARPWFGMVAGARAAVAVLLAPIAVLFAALLGLWLYSLVSSDSRHVVAITLVFGAALGVAPLLCLAPVGQFGAWARHFLVAATLFCLGQVLAFSLEALTVALAPPGACEPIGWSQWVARLSWCALWIGVVIAAVPVAWLCRKGFGRRR